VTDPSPGCRAMARGLCTRRETITRRSSPSRSHTSSRDLPASVQNSLSWTQSTASPPAHRRRHRRFTLGEGRDGSGRRGLGIGTRCRRPSRTAGRGPSPPPVHLNTAGSHCAPVHTGLPAGSLSGQATRRLYTLCWREHSRRKLSPTLATAYYSCPDNASSPM